jgi:NAD(P)-dependent dehydrogenase (short-subunit alcohol dehydrogenase family)
MMRFNDRVAIVTGASRGIGRAIATRLAAEGATVIAAARGDNAQETVAAITAAGGKAEIATADMTDPASRRWLQA